MTAKGKSLSTRVAVETGACLCSMSSTVALQLIARQPKTRFRLKQFGRLVLHNASRHNVSAIIRSRYGPVQLPPLRIGVLKYQFSSELFNVLLTVLFDFLFPLWYPFTEHKKTGAIGMMVPAGNFFS
ncbi:MAG: hypothetical protein K4571_14070 [Deltaproteobacteria bacterium]